MRVMPSLIRTTLKLMSSPRRLSASLILDGHEYVAAQARKAGVGFTKQENCFTSVSNAADLAKIADTLSEKETAGRLRQLCERWIYSTCLCFALDLEEQKKSTFQYQYSVFQAEYSRNLLFRSGRQMDEIFQALIDRTRAPESGPHQDHFRRQEPPALTQAQKESYAMRSRGRDTYV